MVPYLLKLLKEFTEAILPVSKRYSGLVEVEISTIVLILVAIELPLTPF